jgi:hypothetical protein
VDIAASAEDCPAIAQQFVGADSPRLQSDPKMTDRRAEASKISDQKIPKDRLI